MKRIFILFLILLLSLSACSNMPESTRDVHVSKDKTLKIVSGSENKELEPIIKAYGKKNNVNIEIDYLGSLDIMNLLKEKEIKYDAVWPASSIWLTLGDTNKVLKHAENTSYTPVVFGIKKSIAKQLGFSNGKVAMSDIRKAVNSKKLNFAMTSATQSNSGASAYFAFLASLTQQGNVDDATLKDPKVKKEITSLLAGVERSSGSSNWLVDLFLKGDYDAMVNYESLIIKANRELEKSGKETLTMIYPSDGVAISDSPLAYVDKKDKKKEKMFLDLQQYILSDDAQKKIEATGKRPANGPASNEAIFNKDYGIDLKAPLNPIRYPSAETMEKALKMYQTEFKKPAMTLYVMDYSSSMSGQGKRQMLEATNQIFIEKNAAKNFLQGSSDDETYAILFSYYVINTFHAHGNSKALESMQKDLAAQETEGGTDVYEGLSKAFNIIEQNKAHLKDYSVAVIVMSDGMTQGHPDKFFEEYRALGLDIPIYSIMYGDAYEAELQALAKLSNGKVFDGRKNLTKAFKEVKGYN